MLLLHFSGWFQCRLATNPDPTDEPRGVSGFTFAVAGEPDLDRIIRFQEPVSPRSHGPPIGVSVDLASLDGERIENLVTLRVDLLQEPKFESRNLLLTDDRSGSGLIHPFHLQIEGDGLAIARSAVVYPADVSRPLHEIPATDLNRFAPVERDGFNVDPERIARAVGITSALSYRANRRRRLEVDLADARDPTERAALTKRLDELSRSDPLDMRVLGMSLTQTRRFALDGPFRVDDEHGRIDTRCDLEAPWPIEFWMGGWDADALCGYVSGRLAIPIQ